MRKKRAITLLEIMIVILLIGLIGGVVSYNLKGTLDKGKEFASKEGAQKLEDILNLEIQQGSPTALELARDKSDSRELVKNCALKSGLISSQQVNKFIKDGWSEFYIIRKIKGENQVLVVSRKIQENAKKHPTESNVAVVETEE